CTYAEPIEGPHRFIVKAWPEFELAPKENIQGMFRKDLAGYTLDSGTFFPRPKAYLADFQLQDNRWGLVLEDAEVYADHKVHEHGLSLEEVMRLVPQLADTAAAWEGCHEGARSAALDEIGVQHWASEDNLAVYRAIMPGGAKLLDCITNMGASNLVEGPTWDVALGPGIAELFTRKVEAFYGRVHPRNGATCTLCHGDLRGDNLFFCNPSAAHPDGWLVIDFQLMFRGPVPSDLAYLMTSATVLPEVLEKRNREQVLRAFYERFLEKTQLYKDYRWEQFEREYVTMSTVLFTYFTGFGAAIWKAGVDNQQAARVELGTAGTKLEDLSPEELRKRMWWRKSLTNFRTCFEADGLVSILNGLPDNNGPMGPWFELPPHLAPRRRSHAPSQPPPPPM
ncbi:MAG: DUF1679 domain-containing protein, partial [Myxococcales bacterium]|nr:DUF1679 domain-containing protein [Myxococcales bacterium]